MLRKMLDSVTDTDTAIPKPEEHIGVNWVLHPEKFAQNAQWKSAATTFKHKKKSSTSKESLDGINTVQRRSRGSPRILCVHL